MNNSKMTLFGFSQFNYLRQLGLRATLVITVFFLYTFILGKRIRFICSDKMINGHSFYLWQQNKYLAHYFPHNW